MTSNAHKSILRLLVEQHSGTFQSHRARIWQIVQSKKWGKVDKMQGNRTRTVAGTLNGIFSSVGFTSNLVLLLILFLEKGQISLGFLVITYLAFTLLIEHFFCNQLFTTKI